MILATERMKSASEIKVGEESQGVDGLLLLFSFRQPLPRKRVSFRSRKAAQQRGQRKTDGRVGSSLLGPSSGCLNPLMRHFISSWVPPCQASPWVPLRQITKLT